MCGVAIERNVNMAVKAIAATLLITGLAGMLGTVGWILSRGNKNKMTRLFIVCQMSIVMWLVSQLLILFSVTYAQLNISYLIGYAGICCFPSFWLMFSAEYSETTAKFKSRARLLPVVSVLMYAVIATNPIHGLYYKHFGTDGIAYGILFYLFQLIFYALIIFGITLMFIRHSKGKSVSLQSMFLALAALVPLLINTLSVCGIIKSEIELTPLFFAFSVIMVLIAIRRYGLLDINQIAIQDTFDNIGTAAAVFDTERKITYINKAMKNLIADDFSDVPEMYSAIGKLSESEINENEDSGEFVIGNERYSLKVSRICNELGMEIAGIILISNITEYYELAQTEKRLSIEHERNRIAQEIHDSAGHTFTMISSLAKITESELKKGNLTEISQYIAEIDGLSRSGITQLRCSINNLRDDEFMTSVTRAVKTVTEAVRSPEVELCIQGKEDGRYSFCIREVYDSVKETVTNAIRYSSADKIDIIMKFLDDRLELYIFDNGKGCGEIKENNGLSGIRRRIEKIGGTVKFSSVEGDGFTTMIKIPIGKG